MRGEAEVETEHRGFGEDEGHASDGHDGIGELSGGDGS